MNVSRDETHSDPSTARVEGRQQGRGGGGRRAARMPDHVHFLDIFLGVTYAFMVRAVVRRRQASHP